MSEITIIGFGNKLMGDDGIGIVVIEELRKEYEVGQASRLPKDIEIIDGCTNGFNIISLIKDKKKVIIIDCVDFEGNPGDIINFRYGEVLNKRMNSGISLHSGDLLQILDMAKNLRLLMPDEIHIIGVQPYYIGQNYKLSEEVNKSIPEVINMVKLLSSEK